MVKAAALALTLAVSAISLSGAVSQPTLLAVIDEHGQLTPFAVYDGQTWWNRWPWGAGRDDIRSLAVPPSLKKIPDEWLPPGVSFPADWKAMLPSGRLMAVRALRPTRSSEDSIMDSIAIRTNAPSRPRDSDGLVAIAGPGVLGRFVKPASDEQQAILRQLATRIAILEEEEIDRWLADRLANGSPDVKLARTFMLETATGVEFVAQRPAGSTDFSLIKATSVVEGQTYYYLDGEKRFTMSGQGECMLNLETAGVVVKGVDGAVVWEKISAGAWAGYCGSPSGRTTPMATLRLNGQTVWIVEASVEDGYDYALMDPDTGTFLPLRGATQASRPATPLPAAALHVLR